MDRLYNLKPNNKYKLINISLIKIEFLRFIKCNWLKPYTERRDLFIIELKEQNLNNKDFDNLLKEYDNLTIDIKNHLSKIGSLKGFGESEYIWN
mgnify:CR=1 FL=1